MVGEEREEKNMQSGGRKEGKKGEDYKNGEKTEGSGRIRKGQWG